MSSRTLHVIPNLFRDLFRGRRNARDPFWDSCQRLPKIAPACWPSRPAKLPARFQKTARITPTQRVRTEEVTICRQIICRCPGLR